VGFSSEQLGVRHIYSNGLYALTKQNTRTLSLPPHIQSRPIHRQSSTTNATPPLSPPPPFDTGIIYSTNTTGGDGHGGNRKNSKDMNVVLKAQNHTKLSSSNSWPIQAFTPR